MAVMTRANFGELMTPIHKKVNSLCCERSTIKESAKQYVIPKFGDVSFSSEGLMLYSDGIKPPNGMSGVT